MTGGGVGVTYPLHPLPVEVRALVADLRRPRTGRLSVASTAKAHGINIARESLGGELVGMEEPGQIILEASLTQRMTRTVFAHEMAHAFMRSGVLPRGGDEELVADQCGDELTLPAAELERLWRTSTSRVASMYGVPVSRAAAQRLRLGAKPDIARLGSGQVVCVRCGDRARSGCECLYFRQNQDECGLLALVS